MFYPAPSSAMSKHVPKRLESERVDRISPPPPREHIARLLGKQSWRCSYHRHGIITRFRETTDSVMQGLHRTINSDDWNLLPSPSHLDGDSTSRWKSPFTCHHHARYHPFIIRKLETLQYAHCITDCEIAPLVLCSDFHTFVLIFLTTVLLFVAIFTFRVLDLVLLEHKGHRVRIKFRRNSSNSFEDWMWGVEILMPLPRFHLLLCTHHPSSGAGTIGQIVANVPSGISLAPTSGK
jgi:hypothetical protein